MADNAVTTRPIKFEEMMAVFAHVQEKLEKEYAGKPLPDEKARTAILQSEVEKVTGVKPAPNSPPTAVASTHEESVAKILAEQQGKHGKMKEPELGMPDVTKPIPTPPKDLVPGGKGK